MESQRNSKNAKQAEKGEPTMDENEIGKIIVDSAIAVHRELGPGLLESVYEAVLAQELRIGASRWSAKFPFPLCGVVCSSRRDSGPILSSRTK